MIDPVTMQAIIAEYKDELEGIAAYGKLFEMMKTQGAPKDHLAMIRDIMKDEMQHKECLYKMLISVDAFTPEPILKATKEANAAYEMVMTKVE